MLDWRIFGYSVIFSFIVWFVLFVKLVLGLIILCIGFVIVLFRDLKMFYFLVWYYVLRKVFFILVVSFIGLIVVVLYFYELVIII